MLPLVSSNRQHHSPTQRTQQTQALNNTPSNVTQPELFFWYIPSPTPSQNLIVWLNGGPGCSSVNGLFLENGPYMFSASDDMLQLNQHSWHLHLGNVVYIDQPIGTGFSFDTKPDGPPFSLQEATNTHFLNFMKNFHAVFPETAHLDLYLTGESFAGIYIPMIADAMILDSAYEWKLKGIALGNPVLDVTRQMNPVDDGYMVDQVDYLAESGFWDGSSAATEARGKIANISDGCLAVGMDERMQNPELQCDQAMRLVSDCYKTSHTELGANNTCFNMYHIDKSIPCNNKDASHHLWRQEAATIRYLNAKETKKALNIPQGFPWASCSQVRLEPPSSDTPIASSNLIDRLIASNVSVLVYDGDRDFVANYVSIERILGNTTWANGIGFSAPLKPLSSTSVVPGNLGLVQSERGVTYVRVSGGAGHLVPADVPESSIEIMRCLIPASAVGSTTPTSQVGETSAVATKTVARQDGTSTSTRTDTSTSMRTDDVTEMPVVTSVRGQNTVVAYVPPERNPSANLMASGSVTALANVGTAAMAALFSFCLL
ncbi:Cell death protease [Chytriomyces hyalinus]|nr:Cell death protease [Chytriomyces hyalinus]